MLVIRTQVNKKIRNWLYRNLGKLGFENAVYLGSWESEVLEMGGVLGGRSCSPNAPRLDELPEEIPGPSHSC